MMMRGSDDEFLRHRDRLARVGLRILKRIGERPAADPAGGIDLIDGKIEAAPPIVAILRVLPGERPADADQHRRAVGLRPRGDRQRRGDTQQRAARKPLHRCASGGIGSPNVCISRFALANIAAALVRSRISRSSIPTSRNGFRSAAVIAAGARVSLAA